MVGMNHVSCWCKYLLWVAICIHASEIFVHETTYPTLATAQPSCSFWCFIVSVLLAICSDAVDVEPVSGVHNGVNTAAEMEISSNTGQPLSSYVNDSDVTPQDTSDIVSDADKPSAVAATPSSPNAHYDLNSNFQHRAKTKGTLRQRLHKKRHQQLVSSSNRLTDSSEKKSVLSNTGASQVIASF